MVMTYSLCLTQILPYLWIASAVLSVICARLNRRTAYYAVLPAGLLALTAALAQVAPWKQTLLFFAVCIVSLCIVTAWRRRADRRH